MPRDNDTESRQNSGRLVAFSDGVVAIAITLLILPLADITLPEDNQLANSSPLEFVWQENNALIVSFLVSWFVILVFWLAHHRMFGELERVNTNIIKWNVLWLFGIIILPFPMNLLDQIGPEASAETASRQATVFYIGTMFFISLMLALISREIRREPTLLSAHGQSRASYRTYRSWVVTCYLLAVLPIAWFFPDIALWALVGLMVLRPISEKVDRVVLAD